jgi:hypothetical protein
LRINLRRGLFRLWIILACLFVITVGIASTGGIRDEFKRASTTNKWGWALMVPVDCSEARGKLASDYSKAKDGLCWYEMPKFRTQYTEYKDLKDDQLSDRLYEKAGIPLTPIRPWTKVMQAAGIALGVPVAVLILGWSLMWAFSGFRHTQL